MAGASNRGESGNRDLPDALRERGFRPAGVVDQEDVDRLREFFSLSESGVSFSDVIESQVAGGRVLVGELRTDNSRQTLAYFASDVLATPAFILQPATRSLYVFSKLLGLPKIDFESHADFNGHYDLSSARPDHARLLFNDEVLAYFGRRPGLQVMGEDYRLVVFRPDLQFENADLDEFIPQALEVFALFETAAEDARGRLADGPSVDPRDAAGQLGGVAGALVRRHLVTRRDIDEFLAQRPPRRVPGNIRRRRLGSTSALFAWLGPLLAAGGLATGQAAGVFAGGAWNEQRISPLIVGAAFALVGGLSGYFAWRYRLRNKRLLRRGQVAPATIERVEATDEYVGREQQHRVSFRVESGGRQWTTECNVDGRAARQARRCIQNAQTVRVLYDPRSPERILWAESLINGK